MTSFCAKSLVRNFTSLYGLKTVCAIHTSSRSNFRGKKFIGRMIQPYDWYEDWSLAALKRWWRKAQVKQQKNDQRYNPQRFAVLGPDLSVAHFVVARGGAVKFEGEKRWITTYDSKDPDFIALPGFYVENLYVEAVNWSGGPMIYESLDNFALLEKLKYLNISNSPNVDDWCLDRFHMFPHLVHLDISGCDKITERGLACLHKLKSLRYLAVHNMKGVKQKPLVAIMMEEMLPECQIDGLTYIGMDNYEWESDTFIPVYLIEAGEPREAEHSEAELSQPEENISTVHTEVASGNR